MVDCVLYRSSLCSQFNIRGYPTTCALISVPGGTARTFGTCESRPGGISTESQVTNTQGRRHHARSCSLVTHPEVVTWMDSLLSQAQITNQPGGSGGGVTHRVLPSHLTLLVREGTGTHRGVKARARGMAIITGILYNSTPEGECRRAAAAGGRDAAAPRPREGEGPPPRAALWCRRGWRRRRRRWMTATPTLLFTIDQN